MLTESRSAHIRIVLASLCLTLLPGCGTLYLLQAAHGEIHVLERRQPIARLVKDPKTPAKLRATLDQVQEAREFASRVLGLPDNRSYRTYSAIDRPYVVWNVVATPEFSVVPVDWCFPLVGCVAYRGYFSEKRARKFAARLRAHGDDVTLGGVAAYSTLGHFADPVLSTMLGYGDVAVAETIFHELAHQLLYVPGDSSFDEAFATTVADEGVRRWLLYQGRIADLERFERANSVQLEFVRQFRRTRAQLRKLYASGLAKKAMLSRKRAAFASLAAQIRRIERQTGETSAYEDWLESGLNNADLASVGTYYDCVPGFERLLRNDLGDLERFYSDVRALAREPQARRDAQLCTGGRGAGAS
jgi:predicted aminopeptidase